MRALLGSTAMPADANRRARGDQQGDPAAGINEPSSDRSRNVEVERIMPASTSVCS